MPAKKPKLKVMRIVKDDKEQQAEETAHKVPAEPVQKKDKPMTLTLGEASGVYYGSRELWVKLFERFGLTRGKLTIKSLEFEPSSNVDEVVVKVVVAKSP